MYLNLISLISIFDDYYQVEALYQNNVRPGANRKLDTEVFQKIIILIIIIIILNIIIVI